jgi:hypothetical protein
MSKSACSALLLTVVVVAGCDATPRMNYEAANLIQARGTVKLDGQPLPNAVVTFESPQNGTQSYGMTDTSGSYRLQFDSRMTGVTPGQKLVKISTTRKILGLNQSEGGGETDPANEPKADRSQEVVPPEYNRKSQVIVDVVPSRQVYDFDLKSKPK